MIDDDETWQEALKRRREDEDATMVAVLLFCLIGLASVAAMVWLSGRVG